MKFRFTIAWLCIALFVIAMTSVGCDKAPEADRPEASPSGQATKPPATTQPLVPLVQAADWCKEHGVPESVCAQCNKSLVDGFKAKGDWCKEHNRPESQCFECHPELRQKFVAAYKEKYGKEPPTADAGAER